MTFRILRAVRHLPARPLSAVLVLLALGWLSGRAARLDGFTSLSRTAALTLTVAVVGLWMIQWLVPALSTIRWVARRDDASEHAGGLATWTDIGEHASAAALRTKARTLRPSLDRAGWVRRWFGTPATAYAVPLAKTSWLPVGNTVWSSCEDVTLRVGGPRSGKSASLACHALDAPGALLVTTSRTDLLDHTRDARALQGRVDVFNPTGLGDLPSTVRWTPLVGCVDYGTAQRRADDLIPPARTPEGERWDVQARGLLSTLLHAATLAGGSMRTVLDWISPADLIARDEILTALHCSPNARVLSAQIRSLYSTNDRTLSSITTTLLPAFKWVNDATIAAVGDAALDDPALLDVAQLVQGGTDSLYLIGRDGGAHTLIGALTAEVAHQVRMHAGRLPGGRLDPPMTALLDEAPLTCGPIPLHDWTADMGGRGFTLHIAAQSLAQLRDVWGRDRAEAILGNTGTLLVFGGLKSPSDLQDLSTLCGSRLYAVDADDNRPLPVMTPAEISALPAGTCLILRNTLRPIVGAAPMIWDRRPSRVATVLRRLAVRVTDRLRDQPLRLPTLRPRPIGADVRTAPSVTRTAGAGAVPTPTLTLVTDPDRPADSGNGVDSDFDRDQDAS